MLRLDDLVTLSENHDGNKFLSAYVPVDGDAGNPGVAWRTLLRQGIARVRGQLTEAPHEEQAEFERCAERLLARADEDMHAQGRGTWIGFASTDHFLHDETVAPILPSLVAWENRPRIVPYFAALETRRTIVAVMDRLHAVFYVAEDGSFSEVDRIETEPRGGAGTHVGAPPSATFHSGTHGLPAADAAARQAAAAFRKHRTAIVDRIRTLERPTDWIVLGGASEAVAQIAPVVGAQAPGRTMVADSITMASTPAELRAAAESAGTHLREAQQRDLVSDLLSGNRHPELNVLKRNALEDALTIRNVDTLVMSRRWVEANTSEAEDLVNRAIAQSARVEIANGKAGEMLDEATGGVGAKLRFSVAAA